MIKTNIQHMRDPFILNLDGVYYAYGTGVDNDDWNNTKWICYKNDSGNLEGQWCKLEKDIAVLPEYAIKNRWAPEVHRYNGSYYLLATYYSSIIERKGTAVFKSESPEGPFVQISDGVVTPENWDCIDGTLYLAHDGTPWMVFVYEWSSTPDGIGRMAAAPMSSDLTHFTSEPIILFKADEAPWGGKDNFVTDGCFMYETVDGQLLMLWSNFDCDGYCIGVARSKNGKIDGEWEHDENLLYSKALTKEFDGGHGMIFEDFNGTSYLVLHSPNYCNDGQWERTVLVPIREENGYLITEF